MEDDSRARSTKTRIETPSPSLVKLLAISIREQDPLKQGLKPEGLENHCILPHTNSRARSTKTRIETGFDSPDCYNIPFDIREQDPLKQGLKPKDTAWIHYDMTLIREQDPLKQGLKLLMFINPILPIIVIREQDPLKQGLKLHFVLQSQIFDNSRARSTKTRIETITSSRSMIEHMQFASKIH